MPRLAATILISQEQAFVTRLYKKAVYVGEPSNISRIFSDFCADELFIHGLDFDYGPTSRETLRRISGQTFIPLTFGGSINSAEKAKSISDIGFEKVCVESSLFTKPEVIREIAGTLGESSTIASFSFMDSKLFSWRSRELYSFDTFASLAEKAQEFGAGEVKINSVSRDGTLSGPDLELVEKVTPIIRVPITYQGGVRNMEDVCQLWDLGVDCVTAASWFTLIPPHDAVLVNFPQAR